MASSRVALIGKIWSSPVISNVLAMFSSTLTIVSLPSRERNRLTAPIRTPSAVESRNVVSVRSTTMRLWPDSIASARADLSSGAVKRSISPRTATTWRSASSDSWLRLNSGGMEIPILSGRCERHAYAQLLAVVARALVDLVGDALQHVADARERRIGDEPVGPPRGQRA